MGSVKFEAEGKLGKAYSRTKWILSSFFEQWRNYGFSIAYPSLAWWIGNYGHKPSISFWALRHLTPQLDRYFENKYQSTISLYDSNQNVNKLQYKPVGLYCIWVFWWQGGGGMPELVANCYKQLAKHNSNVILITKNNIRDYTNIPEEIYTKVAQGQISYTHLSDILRLSLLAERGGMWVDATCFVPYTIPDEAKKEVFYSPSTRGLADMPMWSNSRWCSWNMGSCIKNNPLFMFCRDMLYSIYINEPCIPHYLVMDYVLDYAYRKIPGIKEMIDNHTEYNTKRNELHFKLNKPWNEDEYMQLCKNNWVFKLSYKTLWQSVTSDGKPTFYQILIKGEPNIQQISESHGKPY